ncbi:hypothetical protein B0J18DRAFT_60551 [Chaetomium sp. MPI-SDFR-AT-0129]|nr:hypothetical protein B0J18DRAFT_60551 [Chaetomium sp. MPI-SDFR-AT-0129]
MTNLALANRSRLFAPPAKPTNCCSRNSGDELPLSGNLNPSTTSTTNHLQHQSVKIICACTERCAAASTVPDLDLPPHHHQPAFPERHERRLFQ